ncbi:hypothetical protein SDC9_65226 [bioreactor metagenome]|uniref:Uncharacterized protein n=1 Tax=bioreactor metagenome TaxID=1076179 RepID=A0A644XRF0_9ZZZZ
MCVPYVIPFAGKASALPANILHFHDDRKDHGVALGFFVEVPGQTALHGTFNGGPVAPVLCLAAGERIQDHISEFLHQSFGLLHVNEAAGDDIRPGNQGTVLAGEGHHHHDHTVLRQVFTVSEHHAAHVSHAVAVHKDLAGGNCAVQLGAARGQLNDLTHIADDDIICVHAHFPRQSGVHLQMALLSVDRDEEPGLYQSVDNL